MVSILLKTFLFLIGKVFPITFANGVEASTTSSPSGVKKIQFKNVDYPDFNSVNILLPPGTLENYDLKKTQRLGYNSEISIITTNTLYSNLDNKINSMIFFFYKDINNRKTKFLIYSLTPQSYLTLINFKTIIVLKKTFF